jgi:predicted metalloprotease
MSQAWQSPARRWLAAAVVAIVVAAAPSGCVMPSDDSPGSRPPPGAPTSVDPVTEFRDDLTGAVATVEEYWREQFAAAGRPFRPVSKVIAYERDGEVACGPEPIPRNNAVYCPAGDFIAYDVRWAAAAFRLIGDAFLYFLVGHEYAHGIQIRFGIQYRFTIAQELQADCLAGAYMGDSIRAGRLTLEQGDIEELQKGLAAVGDDPDQPWFAPGAHGTAEQRTNAFFAGYERSVPACDLG